MPCAAATFAAGSSSNYTITYVSGTLAVNLAVLNHAKRRDQDLRSGSRRSPHRVHDERAGGRRHGQWCDRDEHRRSGDGGGWDRPYRARRRDVLGRSLQQQLRDHPRQRHTFFTVNPAGKLIMANYATKTFGQTATFAGTAFTTSGLLNGDAAGAP